MFCSIIQFQVFYALLMAIAFTLVTSHNQSCYSEYQIKTSTKIALQQSLIMKKNEAAELQMSLNAKLVEMQELNTSLKDAQEVADEMESLIDILTTEVEELHTICDVVLAKDCCQVNEKLYNICSIIITIVVVCVALV